ncbi:MAG: response regulator [Acidobacteriota bacterium]
MSRILLVDDDPDVHRLIAPTLSSDGHIVLSAKSAQEGLDILTHGPVDLAIIDYILDDGDGVQFLDALRENFPDLPCVMITAFDTPELVIGALRRRICDFLIKPFSIAELRASITGVFNACPMIKIEVVSAKPDWVQFRVPCDLSAVPVLQKLLTTLKKDVPEQTREAIAYAFREMLNNAMEHGGKLDPSKMVEVAFIRMKHALIYWIKDPGEGFDPAQLEHAAVNNPTGDPFRHITVRDEKGLRAGGFGILLTNQLVDELVYNERRNEVVFVKYL